MAFIVGASCENDEETLLRCSMDGRYMNEAEFMNLPDETGFFFCDVEIWFQQGYFEGWQCDSESELEFVLTNIRPLQILPLSDEKADTIMDCFEEVAASDSDFLSLERWARSPERYEYRYGDLVERF